ncbi:hypothetical protein EVAR_50631_1 [Eumeta japonica]|uniref:Uncharacterized protein n=1 Tax=Eumeta variegata TaxID=151549 RepID=A0A4C1XIK1_EUMVA|nr:hypothetical protein EVAR_50631_1 [Eumeta japonica]
MINETSLHDRTELTEARNKNRESEKEYTPDQQLFIRNPTVTRQKLASRYTSYTVLAYLPIHIYTKKKRGPFANSFLKRVFNGAQLLQSPPDSTHQPPPGTDPGVDS